MKEMEPLLSIFEDVQQSKRSFSTNIKKTIQFFEESDKEGLKKKLSFFLHNIVDAILVYSKKNNVFINRLLQFLASVLLNITDEESQTYLIQNILYRLKSLHSNVRLKICDIFYYFFQEALKNNTGLRYNILKIITDNFLIRSRDKIVSVRLGAVKVLLQIQEAYDPQDFTNQNQDSEIIKSSGMEVLDELCHMIETEESVNIRLHIVKNIILCEASKNFLIRRIKDVKKEIRIATVERLKNETDIRQFKKNIRTEIVKTCLNDRDSQVRKEGEKLIFAWLKLLQNDILKFLSYFNMNEYEETVILVASVIAERVLSDETEEYESIKFLSPQWDNIPVYAKKRGEAIPSPYTVLNNVDLLWAYVRCVYMEKFTGKFLLLQFLSQILPEPSEFIKILKSNYDPNFDQNLKYMFKLVPFIGLKYENPLGIEELIETCLQVLWDGDVDYDLIEAGLFSCWKVKPLISSGNTILKLPMLVILINFIQKNNKNSNGDLFYDEATSVTLANYTPYLDLSAINLTSSLSNLTDNSMKLLSIIQWVLQNNLPYHPKQFEGSLDLVLKCLQQPNSETRVRAITVLSMFCILDENIRLKYFLLLKQVAIRDFEDILVRHQAIQGLLDVCLIAGDVIPVEEKNEINRFLSRIITQDSDESNSIDEEFKLLIMEGTIKLIFSGFTEDTLIVSKLLHFFFINNTEKNSSSSGSLFNNNELHIHQLLSVFFQAFLVFDNEFNKSQDETNKSNSIYKSCFETVRQSISLFVTEFTISVRDEIHSPNLLSKAIESLLGICEIVLVNAKLIIDEKEKTNKRKRDDNNNEDETKTEERIIYNSMMNSFNLLRETIFACICGELLKINDDKVDRIICKEYIRILNSLEIADWIENSDVSIKFVIINTIIL